MHGGMNMAVVNFNLGNYGTACICAFSAGFCLMGGIVTALARR